MLKRVDSLHKKVFSEKNIKSFETLVLYFAISISFFKLKV